MAGRCVNPLFGEVRDKYGQKERLIQKSKAVVCKSIWPLFTYSETDMKEIKRREIYTADLEPVVGSEQGGLRPVLVLQNDIGNRYSPTTIVAAITSRKSKAKLPTHVNISAQGLAKDSIVLLEQIRTIDKSRLAEYIGRADKPTMKNVDLAIVISFGIRYLEELIQ